MYSRKNVPFRTASDLLKVYRSAEERSKYLSNDDDRLLAYNDVITYCAESKFCRRDDSLKRNQILFWTYNRIGDMFMSGESPNEVYALQYYRNALEFTRDAKEKNRTLEKMARLYLTLGDEKKWRETVERMALDTEDSLKRQVYSELARGTDDPKLMVQYLEKALSFIPAENVSVQTKCQHTMAICRRLMSLYEHLNDFENQDRIRNLYDRAQELL